MPVSLVIVVVDRSRIDLQDSRFWRGWLDSDLLKKEIPVVSRHLNELVGGLQFESLDKMPLGPSSVQVSALDNHLLTIGWEFNLQDSVNTTPGFPTVLCGLGESQLQKGRPASVVAILHCEPLLPNLLVLDVHPLS